MGNNGGYNWGYENAKSLANEMAGGGRVSVKNHTRAPRIAPVPAVPPQAPSMPQGLAGMAPPDMGGMKRGGKVKGYAKGGKVSAGKEPPAPRPSSKDTKMQNSDLGGNGDVKGLKKGGRVKDEDADCYAEGGKVKKKDGHWMEKAFANSHGQFKAKAKKAAMSTKAFAEKEKGKGDKTAKQANLALQGMKANHKK